MRSAGVSPAFSLVAGETPALRAQNVSAAHFYVVNESFPHDTFGAALSMNVPVVACDASTLSPVATAPGWNL